MTDYLQAARANQITLVEAYVLTENALIELSSTASPTLEDFKTSEILQKQLCDISADITLEYLAREGYTRDPKTYLWQPAPKLQAMC